MHLVSTQSPAPNDRVTGDTNQIIARYGRKQFPQTTNGCGLFTYKPITNKGTYLLCHVHLKVPSEASIIRTYADLDAEVAAFFKGHYKLLLLIGRPGLGKTEAMKKYLAQKPGLGHLISGKAAPLACYKDCYDFIHRLLIFNDSEVLWKSDNGKTLMRSLTEHQQEKTLQWLSTTKQLGHCPTSFTSHSNAAFVMNRFVGSGDPFYAAILDRGQVLYFDPPPHDIHGYVAAWFHDQEVFDYIGQHLHHVLNLSARAYNLTAEKKEAQRDWKRFFKDRYCSPGSKLWLVQKLENEPKYKEVEDRVNEFIRQGGKCRKTYFNYKKKLNQNGQLRIAPPPHIGCKGKKPAQLDRMALIAQAEAAKALPATCDDGDKADKPKALPKNNRSTSEEKKPARKKDAQATKNKSATPLPAKSPKKPLKPVVPNDDDLEEEPLDVEATVIKKAVGKKKPKAKKAVRGKAVNKRPPAANRRKRRDDSHQDAETVAADIPYLLTLYTPAKCKV